GVSPYVHDQYASHKDVLKEYGIKLIQRPEDKKPYDGVVVAVRHKAYTGFSLEYLKGLCNSNPLLIDVKGLYKKEAALSAGLNYWRL
ncbi:MAG: hypothetical protein Q7T83_00190, partial [Thermodesulfovibrionales bacterium]|nr:hypothetical protein [Thermodesulfovibrionales bacterium]